MNPQVRHYHPDDRLLVVIGMASGASVALGSLASSRSTDGVSWLMVLVQATVAAQGGAAVLWIVRRMLRWAVGRVSASHAVLDAYRRKDTATYTVFLLSLATAVGVQLIAPVTVVLLACFVMAQWHVARAAFRGRSAAPHRPMATRVPAHGGWGGVAFGAIGAAAALQGFAWLRLLTTPLGSGHGLTSLVLGALLAGAGAGAAGGPWLARVTGAGRGTTTVLLLLSALWCAVSAPVVAAVASRAAVGTALAGVVTGFVVLAAPMAVAGAAAALLLGVAARPVRAGARGAAAAVLAGTAVALVLTVDVLLAFLGVHGVLWGATAVWVAASVAARVTVGRGAETTAPAQATGATHDALSTRATATTTALLGALLGAQAVLWGRLIGAANGNRPDTLGHAFAAVLAGAALGLATSRRLQARIGRGPLRLAATLGAIGGAVFYVAMPCGAALIVRDATLGRGMLLVAAAAAAALCAASASVVAAASWSGRGPCTIGIAMLGAAAGAAGMGWRLLDVETVEHAVLFVALAALGFAQGLWLAASQRPRAAGVTALSLVALALLAGHASLYRGFLERVHFGARAGERSYAVVVQGRDGVVGTTAAGHAYADGLYLGDYRTRPAVNAAVAHGAALVPALHRTPRRLLLLGLGTGARAHALAALPGVDSLTIVEWNVRVLDALWRHREAAAMLDDPRVRLHEGDPRRWLMRHADERFDVILTDGRWHWQHGASRLVSAEFQQLLKSRLAPRGVAYLDATGSLDVLYTASGVWRHVLRVGPFVVASDAPFDQTPAERRTAVRAGRTDAGDTADDRALMASLEQLSGDIAPALRRANDLWNITDDNLAAEFKATGAGAWWRALPSRVWRPDRAWPTVLF